MKNPFNFEPAALFGVLQAVLAMAISFHWLTGIGLSTQNDVMVVMAVLYAAEAVVVAYKTNATLLAPATALFKAALTAGAIYGFHISTEQTGMAIAVITAVLTYAHRAGVTPVKDAGGGTFAIAG